MKRSINIKGTEINFDRPKVMGILNVTPDSFSDGGKYTTIDAALLQALKMQEEGAQIIDVGGCSTRPGASDVDLQLELDRVLPIVQKIAQNSDVFISVDTFRSQVAAAAVGVGAHIINDVSAGEADQAMLTTVANLAVPYVAMHKKGTPLIMQQNPQYENVLLQVYDYLAAKKVECEKAGISDVILDPGFGFGKTLEHNFKLLDNFSVLTNLGVPILAGLSRKSMIYRSLGSSSTDSLNGTSFLHAFALQGGASILRVHDVKEAIDCISLFEKLKESR